MSIIINLTTKYIMKWNKNWIFLYVLTDLTTKTSPALCQNNLLHKNFFNITFYTPLGN